MATVTSSLIMRSVWQRNSSDILPWGSQASGSALQSIVILQSTKHTWIEEERPDHNLIAKFTHVKEVRFQETSRRMAGM